MPDHYKTAQRATLKVVAWLLDPGNNYTWWEARNNAEFRRDFKEAITADLGEEIAGLADWHEVMKMLRACSRIMYP